MPPVIGRETTGDQGETPNHKGQDLTNSNSNKVLKPR
jgi:hypothetical protein